MTPDPRIPRIPGIPGMNSKPMIPLQTSIKKSALGPPWTPNLQGLSRIRSHKRPPQREPKGAPRCPKEGHQEPQGGPKGAKGSPRAPQGIPKRAKGGTKEGQKEPNDVQEGPKGAKWRPRGTQRSSLAPQREFKGGLYTQKLPINRTSGRYVNYWFIARFFSAPALQRK